jgi:hypothetical protein
VFLLLALAAAGFSFTKLNFGQSQLLFRAELKLEFWSEFIDLENSEWNSAIICMSTGRVDVCQQDFLEFFKNFIWIKADDSEFLLYLQPHMITVRTLEEFQCHMNFRMAFLQLSTATYPDLLYL